MAVFALVSAWCATRHELWLDEANPWVIARDARSLGGLWFNMRFEPHPPLWYLLLFLLSRLTKNPAAMQALHVAIATGTVAVIAWFAPFRARDKWLLAFGYYLLFEYGTISRGYALGLLLAFSIAAMAARDRASPVRLSLLLAALANTSAFGLIVSGALAVGLLADGGWERWRARRLSAAVLVYAAGVALSVYAMWPGGENMYGRTTHLGLSTERLTNTLDLFWAAFLPVPDIRAVAPWNSNLFLAMPAWVPFDRLHSLMALASVVLCAVVLWSLRRSAAAVLVFAAGTLAVFALLYVEYSGGYRHHGHYFILFVLALWLASESVSKRREVVASGHFLLTALLAIQVLAAAYFVGADAGRPFSYSRQVANFVEALPPHSVVVVAQPQFLSYIGPPLSAYLGRPVNYAYSRGVVRGSYLVYDRVHREGASQRQILDDVTQLSERFGTDVYVVTNHWTPTVFGQAIASFSDHLVPDERNCEVYVLHARLDRGRGPDLTSARGNTPARP